MKLRNKITGEIRKSEAREDGIYLWDEITDKWYKYSLDLLASAWEYYIEPAEPLIKDEKIRKAVKAWAEALDADVIRFERFSQGFSFGDGNMYSSINFDGCVFDLADGKEYTITELCGEEEECASR